MRQRDAVLVGLVTAVAILVLVFGTVYLIRGGLSSGYPLYSRFRWGAGVKQGQPVLLSGVSVGYVDNVELVVGIVRGGAGSSQVPWTSGSPEPHALR